MENLIKLRTLICITGYSYELRNGQKNYKFMPESKFPVFYAGCFLSNYMGTIEVNYSGLKPDKDGNLQPFEYNFPANTFFIDKLIKAFSGSVSLFGKYQENNLTAPNYSDIRKLGTLEANDIKLIKNASKVIKKDDLRPVMECVYLDGSNIVASDGHILYFKPLKTDYKILIPIAAQKWILKQKFITIFESDTKYLFESENSKFEYNKINGSYPEYMKVLTKNELKVKVNRKDFINAISQVEIMANQASNLACLEFSGDCLLASACDSDFKLDSRVRLNIDNFSSVAGCIGFNSQKLLTVLSLCDSDMIKISLKNEFSGCYFNDILLMPMNIEGNEKHITGNSPETNTDEKKHASENSDTDEKIC